MSYEIDFEPVGRRINSDAGDSLLDAAQRAGIVINATCGGSGFCGRCIVQVMSGAVSPPTLTEEAELGEELDQGWRLACQAQIEGDVKVHIPPDSLSTAQRTQTEGQELPIQLATDVRSMDVDLPHPNLHDLRSDAGRIRDALGMPDLIFPLPVLQTLSPDLREQNFHASILLYGKTVAGVRPLGTQALGLAIDLGTTKLAGYIIDMATGETLATAGAMNPQIAYGEDLMARIGHAINKPDGYDQLHKAIIEALNGLTRDLCAQINRSTLDIAEAVIVGNTAMHHFLLSMPVRQLGLAPYIASETDAVDILALEIGLEFAPGARLHVLPNIAGFIGADHVAMLLGSGMNDREDVVLGLDIGTNTEISLIAHGNHYSCSAASGPAFEGAHILHGMRAAPGSIEKVHIHDGSVMVQTIDDLPAVGLCGSGILDVVAQMLKAEIINSRGSFTRDNPDPRIRKNAHGQEFVLVNPSTNGDREITFTRSDINEVQLAKGAIRAGINILFQRAGITEKEIDTVIIAGAFGSYLDVESCIDIGMFPRLERDRFQQVGNAAGAGARMALLSTEKRQQAIKVARQVTYVELTIEPSFSSIFARSLLLG